MVPLDGGTSNELFETLQEWNRELEANVPYFQEPQP